MAAKLIELLIIIPFYHLRKLQAYGCLITIQIQMVSLSIKLNCKSFCMKRFFQL